MSQLLENYLPGIRENGLTTNENATLGGTLAVTGGTTLTGATTITGALTAGVINATGASTLTNTLTGPLANVINASIAAGTRPTLTNAQSFSTVLINSTQGTYITLPTAYSQGAEFQFVTAPAGIATGSYGIVTGSTSIFLTGGVFVGDSGTAATGATFIANGSTHVGIGMNGTTTGGSAGTYLYVIRTAPTLWTISGTAIGSGPVVTPFVTAL